MRRDFPGCKDDALGRAVHVRTEDHVGGRSPLMIRVDAAVSGAENPLVADQTTAATPTRNRRVKLDVGLIGKFAVSRGNSAEDPLIEIIIVKVIRALSQQSEACAV